MVLTQLLIPLWVLSQIPTGAALVYPHIFGLCQFKVLVAYGKLLSLVLYCHTADHYFAFIKCCPFVVFFFYCAICKYYLALLSRFGTIHVLLWIKFASFFYLFCSLTLWAQWSDVITVLSLLLYYYNHTATGPWVHCQRVACDTSRNIQEESVSTQLRVVVNFG